MDIAFQAIRPVFLSTPIHLGGLGLPTPSIGTLLSGQGISNGIFQVFFFPQIHDRWGSKKTFIAGISAAIPAFIMFPIANALARTQGYSIAVWAATALQTILDMTLGLANGLCSLHNYQLFFKNKLTGAIFIFVSTASPNRASLGATNGLSQVSFFSFVRTPVANNQASCWRASCGQ